MPPSFALFRTGGGGRRARDYLSSLSRADVTGASTVAGGGGGGGGGNSDQTSLSAAANSPLTMSNEDLSSTRSMSPRFNSTLVENGGGGGGGAAAGATSNGGSNGAGARD